MLSVGSGRVLSAFGLLAICASMLWCVAEQWTGRFNPSYGNNYMNLFGLVPHSDAVGYRDESFGQGTTGVWSYLAANRPLAQGLRDFTTLIAGLSYPGTAIVQAIALGTALWWAARSVLLWRGPGAALIFVTLSIIMARPFVGTTMTEPLALYVSWLAIPFVVEALRSGSSQHAIVALLGITLALLMRMGSLVTLPALVLWGVIVFGCGDWRRAGKALTIGIGVLAVGWAATWLLYKLYAPEQDAIGQNFAFILCGLTVAGDWSTCTKLYANEAQTLPTAHLARFFYAQALRNVAVDPAPFIAATTRNVDDFLSGLPTFFLNGYGGGGAPKWLAYATVPGLALTMGFLATWRERFFWIAFWLSLTLSAAIIIRDDGWRALYATHALCALFFSFALSIKWPRSWALPSPIVSTRSGYVFVAIIFAALVGPRGMRFATSLAYPSSAELNVGNVYAGGRAMTGFVIVPNDTPPASDFVPFSEFEKAFKSQVPYHHAPDVMLAFAAQRLPIAFVAPPPLNGHTPQIKLFAPLSMLQDRSVPAWRVTLGANLGSDPNIFYVQAVVAADPIR